MSQQGPLTEGTQEDREGESPRVSCLGFVLKNQVTADTGPCLDLSSHQPESQFLPPAGSRQLAAPPHRPLLAGRLPSGRLLLRPCVGTAGLSPRGSPRAAARPPPWFCFVGSVPRKPHLERSCDLTPRQLGPAHLNSRFSILSLKWDPSLELSPHSPNRKAVTTLRDPPWPPGWARKAPPPLPLETCGGDTPGRRQVLKEAKTGLFHLTAYAFAVEAPLGSYRKGPPIRFTAKDLPPPNSPQGALMPGACYPLPKPMSMDPHTDRALHRRPLNTSSGEIASLASLNDDFLPPPVSARPWSGLSISILMSTLWLECGQKGSRNIAEKESQGWLGSGKGALGFLPSRVRTVCRGHRVPASPSM